MPRISRLKLSNLTYHIISRGNNKMRIFLEESDCKKYCAIVNAYLKKFSFWIYNFTLMPTHVHQLLKAESDVSKIMHGINQSYAQYYKAKYKHSGHFWQDRFKSHIITDDRYLLTVARYIERNPLRAKIIKDLKDFTYSSYNFYAFGKKCDIAITANPLYLELFGNTLQGQKAYRDFINAGLSDDASHQTNAGRESCGTENIPAGLNIINEQFIGSPECCRAMIENRFNYRIKPKRGRPKKNQQELIPKLL